MQPLLELTDISRVYRTGEQELHALDGVSLTIWPGEFVAIDFALKKLESGDLCLILIDQVEEALEHIAKRIAETTA